MKYFVISNKKTTGPFDRDKVIFLIRKGTFKPDARISSDSLDWTEIKDHPDFSDYFAKTRDSHLGGDDEEWNALEVAPPSTEARQDAEDTPEAWRVFRNGKIYGPYTLDEMNYLLSEGRLKAFDNIRGLRDAQWRRADSLLKFPDSEKGSWPSAHQPTSVEAPAENIDIGTLIPFKKFADPSLLRKDFVRLLIFFAVIPMLLGALPALLTNCNLVDLNTYIFSLWGIYFCIIWAGAFALLAKPSKAIWTKGVWFGIFTSMIGVPLLLAAQGMPVVNEIYSLLNEDKTGGSGHMKRLAGYILGVGICEEFFKALPLILFTGSRASSKSEFIFLGMMSGFGFAIAENIGYSFMIIGGKVDLATKYSTNLQDVTDIIFFSYGGIISAQMIRYISLPILHAAWSGVVGWFIATAKAYPRKAKMIISIGILAMAVVHGLYDFACGFNFLNIPAMIAVLMVFSAYVSYTEEDKMNLDNNIRFSS